MNSINQHSLGEERGFTLTELVMVIVLIGIL
ncbi:MAG: prepilin-type N-terminal cleavage/methylation domain-containing protein [Rhodocyclaceae bacterium]|nr:prepilin-type N-terminal cleavage/methylation domain-containing protein [Rhodocyclaceae bacterium]